jgi:hypothetical protein
LNETRIVAICSAGAMSYAEIAELERAMKKKVEELRGESSDVRILKVAKTGGEFSDKLRIEVSCPELSYDQVSKWKMAMSKKLEQLRGKHSYFDIIEVENREKPQ